MNSAKFYNITRPGFLASGPHKSLGDALAAAPSDAAWLGLQREEIEIYALAHMEPPTLTQSPPPAGGWIIWNGEDIAPVPATKPVYARLRNGETWELPLPAGSLRWGHNGSAKDIMAYRLA